MGRKHCPASSLGDRRWLFSCYSCHPLTPKSLWLVNALLIKIEMIICPDSTATVSFFLKIKCMWKLHTQLKVTAGMHLQTGSWDWDKLEEQEVHQKCLCLRNEMIRWDLQRNITSIWGKSRVRCACQVVWRVAGHLELFGCVIYLWLTQRVINHNAALINMISHACLRLDGEDTSKLLNRRFSRKIEKKYIVLYFL